eukprot:2001280-Prymnesium_polylepis.1
MCAGWVTADAVPELDLDSADDVGRHEPDGGLDGCLLRDGSIHALIPRDFPGAGELGEPDPRRMIEHVCMCVALVQCVFLEVRRATSPTRGRLTHDEA